MAQRFRLHIDICNEPWRQIRGLKKRLESATALTLASLPAALLPAAKGAEVTLMLTTNAAVRALNHDYRGVDKPTNVLSFPQFERRDLIKAGKTGEPVYVGDIAVAYQVVVKEAKSEDKVLLDHVTHLLIHGLLHLFGYDHDTASKARPMEKLEREIMATLGLPDPYAPLLFRGNLKKEKR